jgi:signal transduction histidine kinase
MRSQRAIDLGIALIAFALTLGLLAGGGVGPEDPQPRDLDGLGVLLAALSSLPLALWRRAPLGIFAFTVAASAVMYGLNYPHGPPFGPTVALFVVASHRSDLRVSGRVLAGVIVSLFAIHSTSAWAANRDEFPTVQLLLGVSLWSAVWFAGERVRLRRERMEELEERALRAEREAERERQLATAEERTRIARDLHDSAGHAINVILVQAGAARLLSEKDPERSRGALETIETVARETLTEIDRLVGALRDEGGPRDEDGSVEPPRGVAALESLAQRHRAAGLDVAIAVDGERRTLPPAVDQAAYRIVQESLTNALLHGRGSADVALTFAGDVLEIAVTNPLPPHIPAAGGGGHGIIGMRERAVLVGGRLETGRNDGVFRVFARLPYVARERA